MNDEYPPFVTVLRSRDQQFYAAVMEWDRHQEVYQLSSSQSTGTHTDKDSALGEAGRMAIRLGLEIRED